MAKAHVYHNPYDARNFSNPALKKHRAEAYMNSKDVMQANLEKDLLHRLQQGYLRFPRGGLAFLVYAGKFLLFMITLPPYVLFYGVPKWLMQNQFPRLSQAVKRAKDFVQAFISKVSSWVRRISHTLTPNLEPLKKQMEAFSRFVSKWREVIGEYRFQTRQFFIYLPNKLAAQGARFLKFLETKMSRIPNPFLPLQNWVSEKAKMIEKGFIRLGEFLSRFVADPYNKVKNRVAQVAQLATYVLRPPLNWVKEKVKIPVEYAEKAIKKTREILEPRIEKVREWSRKVVETGEKTVQQVSQTVQAAVQAVVVPVINLFAPLAAVKLPGGKALSRGKGARKKLIEKVSKAKNHLKSASKKIITFVKKAIPVIKKALVQTFRALKKTPMFLWKLFLKFLAFLAGTMDRTARMIHTVYTWVRVIYRYLVIEIRKEG